MQKRIIGHGVAVCVVTGTLVCTGGQAAGSGIAVLEQDARRLGTAFAGGAAAADDATTVYYNPAGLARLAAPEATGGIHVIVPSARFSDRGSTHISGQPLSGNNGGDAGSSVVIPNFYFAQPLGDRLTAGLGVYAPFGLITEYDRGWVGRYHAVKSELSSVEINPSVGFRVTDGFSIGAGISAQYFKAELSNAIDFGTIFGALGAPGMVPQHNDGFVTFKGDSWSWGYHVGALYEFPEGTRVGAVYHSRTDHTLTGNAYFSGVPAPNPTGRFVDGTVRADVTLPDSLSVSAWHDLTDDLSLMADVTWTHWSTVDELRIRFDNPAESDAVTTLKWEDTYRIAIGAEYTPSDWTLRVGTAYEQSPVPNAALRTPRVPDNDRIWIAAGIGYDFSDTLSVNASYAHLFIKDADIRKTPTAENQFRGGLNGSYASSVDIVGVELSWAF